MGGSRTIVVHLVSVSVIAATAAGCLPQKPDPQYAQQPQPAMQPVAQQPVQQPQQPVAQPQLQPQPVAQPQPLAQPQPVAQQPVYAQQQPVAQPQYAQPQPQQPVYAQPQPQPQPQPVYGQPPPSTVAVGVDGQPAGPDGKPAYWYRPTTDGQPTVVGGTTPTETRSRLHEVEVIGDFAAVGILGASQLIVRQDITNQNAGTFLVLGGLVAGGGAGYLLTQHYDIDAGAAHATTIGLALGAANGALLIQPSNYTSASPILGLITVGSLVGAAGGFVYGQAADLTSGQSTFLGNLLVLGASTAALTAATANHDGHYGGFENTTIAIGLDAGAVVGAALAPRIDWSPKRSKIVFASTLIGAAAGAIVAGTVAGMMHNQDGSSGDTITAQTAATATTVGLWAGFGFGMLITRDKPKPMDHAIATPRVPQTAAATPTTFVPWVGDRGQVGMMAGGSF